jgi:uncharacterized paraquat-inducible protein A
MKYTNQILLFLITNIKKICRFLYALFWHIISGFPTANSTQILERYDICVQCENFNKDKSICNICGCNLSRRKEFMNKLAWADSECPINKWSSIRTDRLS